jgi:RNA polymerase sigma-70 factor, ECF subfamily
MSEVTLIAGEGDAGLRERLDQEISAFNAAATGYHDARLLSIAARGTAGTCTRGCPGGHGADAATSSCYGSGTASAVTGWAPGSWPPPRPRSGAAAVTGSPWTPTPSRRPASRPGSGMPNAAAHRATRTGTTASTCSSTSASFELMTAESSAGCAGDWAPGPEEESAGWVRGGQLRISGPELDDLAHQAAADAVVAIIAKVGQFRGESRFTTWAYKFVILEVSAKVGRHFWRKPHVPMDTADWDQLPDRLGLDPARESEWRDLARALRRAVEQELTGHQRRIFTALVVDGVPLDALVARLGTSRGAIYKTMFDARRKLRASLVANGYLDEARERH